MAEMDDKQRIEVVAEVFRAIADHMREGGPFRYLIYDRLGLEANAYNVLYRAGGMAISNFIHNARAEGVDNG